MHHVYPLRQTRERIIAREIRKLELRQMRERGLRRARTHDVPQSILGQPSELHVVARVVELRDRRVGDVSSQSVSR